MEIVFNSIRKTLSRLARIGGGRRHSKTYSIGKSTVNIGLYTYGFENLNIREWGEGADLTIGSYCSIADKVQIFLGGNHRVDWVSTFPFPPPTSSGHPATKGDVQIGNDVWIGSGATILSGVTIGDGAVVAANATVTRNIGPYEIWVGNPATFKSQRFDPVIVAKLLTLSWWSLPPDEINKIAKHLSAPPDAEVLDSLIHMHRTKLP